MLLCDVASLIRLSILFRGRQRCLRNTGSCQLLRQRRLDYNIASTSASTTRDAGRGDTENRRHGDAATRKMPFRLTTLAPTHGRARIPVSYLSISVSPSLPVSASPRPPVSALPHPPSLRLSSVCLIFAALDMSFLAVVSWHAFVLENFAP